MFISILLGLLFLVPLFVFITINKITKSDTDDNSPKSYPFVGHLFAFYRHKGGDAIFKWMCNLIRSSPTATFTVRRPLGEQMVLTANPANVEHILKTKFSTYQKGEIFNTNLRELLGNGILNVEGDTWKFQRHIAGHEFSTKSLRKFTETVVDYEVSERLVPVLHDAAKNNKVLDLQDILQRFAFDNVCKIAFGYDPEYLSLSLPQTKFALAFDDVANLTTLRFRTFFPILWKIRRFLNIGSEKRLKEAISEVRELAISIVQQKKQELLKSSTIESEDLLSRFLKSGQFDETTVVDNVVSFVLGGRDTSSASLTWFFWILNQNKRAEEEIVKEIRSIETNTTQNQSAKAFNEVKEMVYTHAALCESMRLNAPVPVTTRQAAVDDVLPDGTPVKKGVRVSFYVYVMGRSEKIWGPDWEQYRPERWLEEVEDEAGDIKRKLVPYDAYSYPVFQGGPRICIGKDMAFLQMKRAIAGVLSKFRVIPVAEDTSKAVYVPHLTAMMKDGFHVRIEERV